MSSQPRADEGFRVHRLETGSWQDAFSQSQQQQATAVLESGGLILFPRLAFALADAERDFLVVDCVRPKSKHVSFDLRTGRLRGIRVESKQSGALSRMLERYARQSLALVQSLFPHYAPMLQMARTSFRPVEASGRVTPWRKDDRLLHVDAFPSSPNQGKRLLRVFSNINPEGRDRVWNIGEPFEAVATRFLPVLGPRWPGYARMLHLLGITRGLRTEYDQIMLRLHDGMKADRAYQASAVSTQLRFAPGSTWIVQTDVVSHAGLSGQFMMEQTFLVPIAAMAEPTRSPLRILERLVGRQLA